MLPHLQSARSMSFEKEQCARCRFSPFKVSAHCVLLRRFFVPLHWIQSSGLPRASNVENTRKTMTKHEIRKRSKFRRQAYFRCSSQSKRDLLSAININLREQGKLGSLKALKSSPIKTLHGSGKASAPPRVKKGRPLQRPKLSNRFHRNQNTLYFRFFFCSSFYRQK